MTQTSKATQITAKIAKAREDMQMMIENPIFSAATRARQELRINLLKAELSACPAY